jgi:hypothetical protein
MLHTSDCLDPLATRRFIQIPGPNPLMLRGNSGEWDEGSIEGGDIFKDYHEGREVYYLYYHGVAGDKLKWPRPGYRIGVATTTQPLGPFNKAPQNPLLDLGPEGAWDDQHVACPCIMKQGPGKYLMWYSGSRGARRWDIGLATASHPLGPWRKFEGNPILKDFGYVGGVVLAHGKYYMYNEHPIGSTAQDYGPFSLATANDPYGPWEIWEGNPVLAPTGWGAWDDGGYSEAKVVYREGVFHTFYGAAKEHAQRMRTLESIGYAFSRDGYHFCKHVDNPVALREKVPGASAFSEVKCLFEPPFVYLYHTLRYLGSEPPKIEDLGVQVLAMSTPFKLNMPVLRLPELGAGVCSDLAACPAINLDGIATLALTVQCGYAEGATAGVRVHVRASADGFSYDTVDWQTFDNVLIPGQVAQRTVEGNVSARFVKLMVENLDLKGSVCDLNVTAVLGS